ARPLHGVPSQAGVAEDRERIVRVAAPITLRLLRGRLQVEPRCQREGPGAGRAQSGRTLLEGESCPEARDIRAASYQCRSARLLPRASSTRRGLSAKGGLQIRRKRVSKSPGAKARRSDRPPGTCPDPLCEHPVSKGSDRIGTDPQSRSEKS